VLCFNGIDTLSVYILVQILVVQSLNAVRFDQVIQRWIHIANFYSVALFSATLISIMIEGKRLDVQFISFKDSVP